jgi:hypothetical protein
MKKINLQSGEVPLLLFLSTTITINNSLQSTMPEGSQTINSIILGSKKTIGYCRDSVFLYPAIHLIIHASQS